ncbi:hypothetical protein A9Q98_14865 [Thalassotalea sp. 42_200_T64]|nr:hypothetical protein A9Q98_14865 [Thalassotalea sp. 42_200_T64]
MADLFSQELKARRQTGLEEAYQTLCRNIDIQTVSFAEGADKLAVIAAESRQQTQYQKAIKQAGLPCSRAHYRDVDYTHARRLEMESFNQQFQLHWVEDKANIVITGPSQIGKNWLGSALAVQAIQEHYKVKAYRIDSFLDEFNNNRERLTRAGKSALDEMLRQIRKLDVLFLFGLGIKGLTEQQCQDLEAVIRLLSGELSLIVTSPIASHSWLDYFDRSYIGEVVVNRILTRSIVFDLSGKPYTNLPTPKKSNGKAS